MVSKKTAVYPFEFQRAKSGNGAFSSYQLMAENDSAWSQEGNSWRKTTGHGGVKRIYKRERAG